MTNVRNATVAILLVLVVSACASVAKIDPGARTIGERLSLEIDGSWNHVTAPGLGPAEVWTIEGLPVDQLLIYSGVKDGELLHASGATAGGRESKSFAFRSRMQPEEVVAQFEGLLTRDGSAFKLGRLEPYKFAGDAGGFRFEFLLTRKVDNVRLSGLGFATVNRGELFALLYVSPRIVFYQRHSGRIEGMAKSARIKG